MADDERLLARPYTHTHTQRLSDDTKLTSLLLQPFGVYSNLCKIYAVRIGCLSPAQVKLLTFLKDLLQLRLFCMTLSLLSLLVCPLSFRYLIVKNNL